VILSNKPRRKLQVSNGFYLDFDQLARLIHTIANAEDGQKISFSFMEEETGLPFRQVENRLSMGRAMGLIVDRSLGLTPFGQLVAKYDTFFESKGTLESIHYFAASREKNLLWYDVFNDLLINYDPLGYEGWLNFFRTSLAGQYSERSLRRHISEEVRFLIQAYTENNLKKLGLIVKDSQGKLSRRRYLQPTPLVFCAILYDYAKQQGTELMQVEDLLQSQGSPPVLFFMGKEVFVATVEKLHDKGYIRYEGTHDLNQLRLKEEYCPESFLKAHYENKEPVCR